MGGRQLDLTQSSEDKALESQTDSDTIVATNRMTDHIRFFLPKLRNILEIQKETTTLGSAMKADRAYNKDKLDGYYVKVTCPKAPINLIHPPCAGCIS